MARQIFISYSKKDSPFAMKIAGDLEDAGYRVWIDREIGGGQQWRITIENNIQDSAEMIVIVSKNSIASRWVQHESSVAYGLGKPIIPILMESVEGASQFVWMDEIQFIDFERNSYEVAFKSLIKALTPPNPVQDLLDQQVAAYRQTGDLIGEVVLALIDEERARLKISAEAQELIDKSAKAVQYNRRLIQGGAWVGVFLLMSALFLVFANFQAQTEAEAARLEAAQSLTTLTAVVDEIVAVSTQQAELEVIANAASFRATEQFATSQAQIETANEQIAAAATAQAQLEIDAAQAAAQLDAAENELGEIFEETGLVFTDDGPRHMVWDGENFWVANQSANNVQLLDTTNGRVKFTIPVGDSPVYLAVGGDYLWVANQGDDNISRIGNTDYLETRFEVGDGPRALHWIGDSLWVANELANTLMEIDAETGQILNTIEVDDRPVSLAFDGIDLWVANFESNSIQRININTGQVTGRFFVQSGPSALLYAEGSLWIANRVADRVQQFDPAIVRVVRTIDVADSPAALAYDGAGIWVANRGDDSVQLIDPATGQVMTTYAVGDFPLSLLWDGENIWSGNYNANTLSKLDRSYGSVVAVAPVGDEPNAMLLSNNSIWVTTQGDRAIQQIDLNTRDAILSVSIDGRPAGLVYDGNGLWALDFTNDQIILVAQAFGPNFRRVEASGVEQDVEPSLPAVEVGNGPQDAIFFDGYVWVVNLLGDELVQVDPVQFMAVNTYLIGDGPSEIVTDGAALWVGYRLDRKIHKIDPTTGEILLEIDLEDGVPSDIVWDNGELWVAFENLNEVRRYDLETGEWAQVIAVADRPVAIALEPELIWVASQNDGLVQRIDRQTGQITAVVQVGDEPIALIISNDGKIWVATKSANAIQLIDDEILKLLVASKLIE